MQANILNNLDFSFDYKTLIQQPDLITNGVTGEYDFENVTMNVDYFIPNSDENFIKGYSYYRVDNDNDFIGTGFYNETSDNKNEFVIKTKYGNLGYIESNTINTGTINSTVTDSYFYFGTTFEKKYNFGNNITLNNKILLYIDSNSSNLIKIVSDIEKFYRVSQSKNDFMGIGTNISYTYFQNPKLDTSIRDYIEVSPYVEYFYKNIGGVISYDITKPVFKGANTFIDPKYTSGFNGYIARKHKPSQTPLNTSHTLGWN